MFKSVPSTVSISVDSFVPLNRASRFKLVHTAPKAHPGRSPDELRHALPRIHRKDEYRGGLNG